MSSFVIITSGHSSKARPWKCECQGGCDRDPVSHGDRSTLGFLLIHHHDLSRITSVNVGVGRHSNCVKYQV